MRITRRIWTQLAILCVVAVTAFAVMTFGYLRLPVLLFGVGHYTVTVQLPQAAGLYQRANVTYRGTEVGQVKDVVLSDSGVNAILSLRSDVKIPANLEAEVHSNSAVGEQYVALLPRTGDGPALKNGDVIPVASTRVPPDINALLDATNRGLQAIPRDNLKIAIDESYIAIGGLGPDIHRIVKGSTNLAIDAEKNLPDLLNIVDNSAPLLDTQTDTADSVRAWAAHLADITQQVQSRDGDLQGLLRNGAPAADEVRALFDRLQPTVPILAANLASIAPVLVTYRPNLEQILVLLPQGVADQQAVGVAARFTKQSYKGSLSSFNLNLNLPPPCTTGYLPAQQRRVPSFEDYPDRPTGDLYCRVPQDSPQNVRGARNIPCETRPGKRAPTVKMCESDENYVPLNDGMNWKGDPNATLSGQDIPQLPPHTAAAPQGPPPIPLPPTAVAHYDPATGAYVGPDGHVYTQGELARPADTPQTWQSMLSPPRN
jgi:phospholipid/cholesterol/gamma-HCH transport system substrate-binding protein